MLVQHPDLQHLSAVYTHAEMMPLCVTAQLDQPIAGYHNLHLDALLSWAVVQKATQGEGLPPSPNIYDIPLPLKVLWHDPLKKLPLWASTDFAALADSVHSKTYFHRRAIEPHMSKKNLRTTQGRHKEKRTPIPTLTATSIYADCYGNPEEIADLLYLVDSVGKKRHTLGAVRQWRIEAIPEFSLVEFGKLRRPIPTIALYQNIYPLDFVLTAFTPPYWHPMARQACMVTGQFVEEPPDLELRYK